MNHWFQMISGGQSWGWGLGGWFMGFGPGKFRCNQTMAYRVPTYSKPSQRTKQLEFSSVNIRKARPKKEWSLTTNKCLKELQDFANIVWSWLGPTGPLSIVPTQQSLAGTDGVIGESIKKAPSKMFLSSWTLIQCSLRVESCVGFAARYNCMSKQKTWVTATGPWANAKDFRKVMSQNHEMDRDLRPSVASFLEAFVLVVVGRSKQARVLKTTLPGKRR